MPTKLSLGVARRFCIKFEVPADADQVLGLAELLDEVARQTFAGTLSGKIEHKLIRPDGMLVPVPESHSFYPFDEWERYLQEEQNGDFRNTFTPRYGRENYRPILFLDKEPK